MSEIPPEWSNSMRKAIPKKIREAIYKKYNGHCAYCGCELEYKDMQVDHIDSVYAYNDVPSMPHVKQEVKDSYKTLDELNEIDNLMPSCRACNFYKSSYGIEDFRRRISNSLERNLAQSFNYKMLLKYGLITRTPHDVTFYFEREKKDENRDDKILEALEQEPCGDAISRQAALDIVDGYSESQSNVEDVTQDIISDIVALPSVNPQEPKYCDRNICIKNEYNGIGCDECEVTKSREPKTDDMTSSHSELDIYKGCIDLMNDLLRQVYEWLEIVGIDVSEMDEDEQFATHFYTTEIVERLFLWKTSHSGGTSQRMKLKELGITDDAVLFDFAKMVEPQESEG